MKTQIDVSIIIVNYNTRQLTQNCINSIFQHTHNVCFEVIVVDNDSTDGSKEMLASDARIRYIQSGANLGFGKANNRGYAAAKGKYLFLLNSDTILLNNAIKLFYDIAEGDASDVGCWGTMLLDNDGKEAVSYGKFIDLCDDLYLQWIRLPWSMLTKKPLKVNWYNYPTKGNSYVDYITGADIFIRKEIADLYGLFDPAYFMYFEETDMQRRYASHNIKRRICTQPMIIHLEGGSQNKKKINYKLQLIRFKSKLTYLKKWNSTLAYYSYIVALSLLRIPIVCVYPYPLSYKKEYFKILFNT